MTIKKRYLTKSRFKIALECPTKLFYTGKVEYVNKNLEDGFLEALAKGGFQVGELAKLYFPGGHNIEELDHDIALKKTNDLLKTENVIIYEAAFLYKDLFIRVDILKKTGNKIDLIEVKAKSYNPGEEFSSTKGIKAEWKPYLFDVAFQKYVLSHAYSEFDVSAYLMLSDKSRYASIDGLNQKFFLYKENGRNKVKVVGNIEKGSLGTEILSTVNIDDVIQLIFDQKYDQSGKQLTFEELIEILSESYVNDKVLLNQVGSKCGLCEYKASNEQISQGEKSGFHECWRKIAAFNDNDFELPNILKVWDFRKKDEFILSKKYFQHQLDRSDLEPKSQKKAIKSAGLSRVDRQELQITKSKTKDSTHFFDVDMKNEMVNWKFPLHFIDFETSAVAIPFNKNRRPYEQIAFQFSHHVVNADGTIEHKGQWINNTPGYFPNYDFVRMLKKELENDNGTIFRYAAHENSILNAIRNQLLTSDEGDKEELCSWIKTITKSSGSSVEKWEGDRNMVDMRELVLKYYYHPMTEGSNSIKYVLPSILNESVFLKEKYSKPIYGKDIFSSNYNNHQWIHFSNNGEVLNPYNQLPKVFDKSADELDNLVTDEELGIYDGGTAMMAYAQMQFTEMSSDEREKITTALLRYCELDTFAMVMIYEAWKAWIK
jgi:hypothetical protein